MEREWILYQIGSDKPNVFRYVLTQGFQDVTVESLLRPSEFIDTTTTLSGHLGGDVTVLTHPLVGSEIFERLKALSDAEYEAAVATVRKLARGEEVSDGELADALNDMSSRLDLANALLPLCSEMVERFMRRAGIEETPRGLTLAMIEEAKRDAEERSTSQPAGA